MTMRRGGMKGCYCLERESLSIKTSGSCFSGVLSFFSLFAPVELASGLIKEHSGPGDTDRDFDLTDLE